MSRSYKSFNQFPFGLQKSQREPPPDNTRRECLCRTTASEKSVSVLLRLFQLCAADMACLSIRAEKFCQLLILRVLWRVVNPLIKNDQVSRNSPLTDLLRSFYFFIPNPSISLKFIGSLNSDLSETSITRLPTVGLHDLEILKLVDTYTLTVIPSVFHFSKIKEAHLTYSYHCCAFSFPDTHDQVKEYEQSTEQLRR